MFLFARAVLTLKRSRVHGFKERTYFGWGFGGAGLMNVVAFPSVEPFGLHDASSVCALGLTIISTTAEDLCKGFIIFFDPLRGFANNSIDGRSFCPMSIVLEALV